MPQRLSITLAGAVLLTGALLAYAPQTSTPTLGIDAVKPGMIGVGRTVFAGETIEEFKATILGTLKNVIGPGRNLIIAKLEGGPLASTGVIAGMSGSPVYIDGKLVGAVSYSLGSFAKEPFAGITPIGEMIDAVDTPGPRGSNPGLALPPGATAAQVFGILRRAMDGATAPLGAMAATADLQGASSLAALVPGLRPIGSGLVLSGIDPAIGRDLRHALSADGFPDSSIPQSTRPAPTGPLRPGDPVGVSLVRGDLEMGATGTVTHVNGNRVYAFGHPFLNLGPTTMVMTRANVIAVLPSLDSSLKIATLGAVVGTMNQDRAVAIGGTLGPGPKELAMAVTLTSARAPERRFSVFVLQDQLLTPLFSFVTILNAISAYERQVGALSLHVTGSVSFGADGQVAFDDFFTGDAAASLAAGLVAGPIGALATNEFRTVLPQSVDMRIRATEQQESATIERVWLDTTKPRFGATHQLQVLLRDYRGGAETVTIPVTMPAQASGPLTLLVSDGATLASLEQRELRLAKPTSFEGLIAQLNLARHGNRVYATLLRQSPGAAINGDNLPALPPSAQSILDADKSVASTAIARSIVASWDKTLDRAVRGSRELTLTLTAAR
jgi:hypothetical protein